jgi:hypothetical protein
MSQVISETASQLVGELAKSQVNGKAMKQKAILAWRMAFSRKA